MDKLNLKLDEVLGALKKKDDGKTNPVLIVFAVIGVCAAVALVVYLVWKFMAPDYYEDYDDYDDEFEDEDEEEARKNEAVHRRYTET